jgi:DNA-binding NtrC family response regulator
LATDLPLQHLLLVDDEAGLPRGHGRTVGRSRFRVEQANTGEAALERLNDFAFDVLITDLRLPGVDGRQVLDEAFARYPEILAIVITGFGTVREAVEVTRLGAEGFITKPFQFEELLHELNARSKNGGSSPRTPTCARSSTSASGSTASSAAHRRCFSCTSSCAPSPPRRAPC